MTTTTPSSNIVNSKDKESNTEWVVQDLVESGDDDDNTDESNRHCAILDLNNNINNDARLLLQKSDLSFLHWSGNQFQPMKRKSGRRPSKDVPLTVVRSLLRKIISGHNTFILGVYPNDTVKVKDAGDVNSVIALVK